jgi:hypothetical protein
VYFLASTLLFLAITSLFYAFRCPYLNPLPPIFTSIMSLVNVTLVLAALFQLLKALTQFIADLLPPLFANLLVLKTIRSNQTIISAIMKIFSAKSSHRRESIPLSRQQRPSPCRRCSL